MPAPSAIFENNDKAAHAVSQYIDRLRPSPQRFVLRPYQFQAPAFTEWWFVPSAEWPAYRFSKLCFHQYRPAPNHLYTGFYVEKGLDEVAADLPDVKPSHIMQPGWYWFKFLDHAQAGELDIALRDVLTRSQCPVFVSVDVYAFNRVPAPGEDRHAPDDAVEFAVRSADLRFELVEGGKNVLSSLNQSITLRKLAQHLDGLYDLDWYWVNVVIGVKLRYGDDSTGTWGAGKIWRNALQPWTAWVR